MAIMGLEKELELARTWVENLDFDVVRFLSTSQPKPQRLRFLFRTLIPQFN
jgi:hypothetical protein